MYDLCDVLEDSYGSADSITHGLCEYGGTMGNGIRKLADEAFTMGSYFENQIVYRDGFKEGSFSTLCAIGTVVICVWGIKEAIAFYKSKKSKKALSQKRKIEFDESLNADFESNTATQEIVGNFDVDTYDSATKHLLKVQRKIDDFFTAYPSKFSKSESTEILNLLAEKLEILKEVNRLSYQKICNDCI